MDDQCENAKYRGAAMVGAASVVATPESSAFKVYEYYNLYVSQTATGFAADPPLQGHQSATSAPSNLPSPAKQKVFMTAHGEGFLLIMLACHACIESNFDHTFQDKSQPQGLGNFD